MSEKHLIEKEWKSLLSRLKIKETPKETKVTNALKEFGECDKADADAQIEALAIVDKEAKALKNDPKTNEEVEAYLAEMLKQVVKSRETAEHLQKAQKAKPPAKPAPEMKGAKEKGEEKPDDAKKKEEAGDDMPPGANVKSLLTGAMGKVKTRKPDDPPMGAMLCQLGEKFGVLLSANVGSAQQNVLKTLLKGTGHKFVKGTCEWGQGDIYTFVLQSPLSGAAKGLKAFFQEQTGVSYKLRVGTAGAMEEEVAETTQPAGAKPPEATGAKQPGAKPPEASGAKPPGDEKPGEQHQVPNPTLSGYVKARKEWNTAKAAVVKNIGVLKKSILDNCDPELEALVKPKINVWDGILGVVDDNLFLPMIEAAIKETEATRHPEHHQKLAASVASISSALMQHPLAAVADENPFGKFYIRAPLAMMLGRLEASFKNA